MPVFNRQVVTSFPPMPEGAKQIPLDEVKVGQLVRLCYKVPGGAEGAGEEGRVTRAQHVGTPPPSVYIEIAGGRGSSRCIEDRVEVWLIEEPYQTVDCLPPTFEVLFLRDSQETFAGRFGHEFKLSKGVLGGSPYIAFDAPYRRFREVQRWCGRQGLHLEMPSDDGKGK